MKIGGILVRRWTLDAGRWTLDIGHWTLDIDRWTLDVGRWTEYKKKTRYLRLFFITIFIK
jgi:hypothetical protein